MTDYRVPLDLEATLDRLPNPFEEGADAPWREIAPRQKQAPRNTTARAKASVELMEVIPYDLGYDDGSGRVIWMRNPKRGPRKAGQVASYAHHTGYRDINYRGSRLKESHVVWLLTQGEWPNGRLLYKDGDKENTRIDNLILEGSGINESGLPPGVVLTEAGRYRAQVYKGRRFYLGTFDTVEEAQKQYAEAKKLVHNPKNWAVDAEMLLKGLMIDYKNRAKDSES